LIRDPYDPTPHPRIADDEKNKNGGGTAEPEKPKKKEKKGEVEKKKINELKKRGDFMKPFLSFYDAKAMEPGLGEKQLVKVTAKITTEVEIAIRQVRSGKNLNANIKKNQMTRNILGMYMDYLESIDTLRIPRQKYNKDGTPKEDKYYKDIKKELMKLVPEQFKISLLPAFFNHIDGERIGTVIRDTATEFLE
jgi:hypothetical protein